jgi:hypothetical protein
MKTIILMTFFLLIVKKRGMLQSNASLAYSNYHLYSMYDGLNQARCEVPVRDQVNMMCVEFSSWQQLLFKINASTVAYANETLISTINAKPTEPIVLTSDLDFWKVSKIMCSLTPDNCYFGKVNILLSGLKAIEISGWSNTKNFNNNYNTSIDKYFNLEIAKSPVEFYMNGSGRFNCTAGLIKKLLNIRTFFNYFEEITFQQSVKYDQSVPWCPYIFADSAIKSLKIHGLVDSFLATNLFAFQQRKNSTSSKSINSKVRDLTLSGYNFRLDETLLDHIAFESVQILTLEGSIALIKPDLFEFFSSLNLKRITISVKSLSNFYRQVGYQWTSYLHGNGQCINWVIFEQSGLGLASWLNPGGGLYPYPNSDLCIFATNTTSLVSFIPILDSYPVTECTDTLTWLTKDYHLYNPWKNGNFCPNSLNIYSLCWKQVKQALPNMTRIKEKISKCELDQLNESKNQVYIEYYEIVFIFKYAVDLLAFIFIPFACIFGILVNLRIINIIHKNNVHELKEDFYQYMMLNSVFNCLFCFIYTFYPINFCLQFEAGYFCSTTHNSVAAQVFKIVFQTYFGEALKMCSNITYIFITINRYMLIGKAHNAIITQISELDFKKVAVVTIIFSLFMNIGHVFQFRLNFGWGDLIAGIDSITYDLYPSIVVYNLAFNVYSIVYFIINFILFFIFNTVVEACLVHRIRQEIAEKRHKTMEEIKLSESHNASHSAVVNKVLKAKQHKIEQDAKKEIRALVMVIANSFVNFVLRSPEILVFLSSNSSFFQYLMFGSRNVRFANVLDHLMSNVSNTMVSLSYLLYIFTFTTNVVIYYLFNSKFKHLFIFWPNYVKQK